MDLEVIKEKNPQYIAGIDEVGRGPLAGPVVCACAAIKKESFAEIETLRDLGITDSKKLTSKKRIKILTDLNIDLDSLKPNVVYHASYGNNFSFELSIAEISHTLVDEMNILAASLYGMEKAFFNLALENNGEILIDGNKVPRKLENLNSQAVVKGDSKSVVIGLASIIAKEYRDLLMKKLGAKYPGYGLESHAGYPTKSHKEALINLGVTPIHRKTFKGVKELL